MQLAMIGLGRMGRNMTERLLRGGHQVVVDDRSAEAVQATVSLGAIGVGTPAELCRTRSDETDAGWRVGDPVLDAWEAERPAGFPNCAAGSWGPAAADELMARAGAVWRT